MPVRSASIWQSRSLRAAPPSTFSCSTASEPCSSTLTMSAVCWAMDSRAARTTCALVVSRVNPFSEPRALRSQCGAQSPPNPGTRWTPPVSGTLAAIASTSSSSWSSPSPSRSHDSVWPLWKTTPSSSYRVAPCAVQATLLVKPSTSTGTSPELMVSTPAVPNVFFASPCSKQACPYRLACWSASTARIGTAPIPRSPVSTPKSASEATTCGSRPAGMPSRASSSSSQHSASRLNSAVREAHEVSVRCVAPPVRFHASQQSTVPQSSSPASARARTPGTSSSNQASLAAEKNESLRSPVRTRNTSSYPAARQRFTMASVWLEIHTIASCTGTPVRRSQISTVSRWLVTPQATTSPGLAPAAASTSTTVPRCSCQSATGSSSTQPGRRRRHGTSTRASCRIVPVASTSTARALLDPSSSAST